MRADTISFRHSPAIRLITSHGDEATVMLHGAQVVSWKPHGGAERIYLSDQADFAPGSAIRGGIPVCFPQFSNLGSGPFHGFVRNMDWQFSGNEETSEGSWAVFRLSDTAASAALWPHRFNASLNVTLGHGSLKVELEITNTGTDAFSFTTALHTYLRVKDIQQVGIEGLEGTIYLDKVANLDNQDETRRIIAFSEQTDRVYIDAPPDLILREQDRDLRIGSLNMPDTVIWNPWIERCLTIPDLPDDGYRSMVCIEAGSIAKPVELTAGKTWRGGQLLTA